MLAGQRAEQLLACLRVDVLAAVGVGFHLLAVRPGRFLGEGLGASPCRPGRSRREPPLGVLLPPRSGCLLVFRRSTTISAAFLVLTSATHRSLTRAIAGASGRRLCGQVPVFRDRELVEWRKGAGDDVFYRLAVRDGQLAVKLEEPLADLLLGAGQRVYPPAQGPAREPCPHLLRSRRRGRRDRAAASPPEYPGGAIRSTGLATSRTQASASSFLVHREGLAAAVPPGRPRCRGSTGCWRRSSPRPGARPSSRGRRGRWTSSIIHSVQAAPSSPVGLGLRCGFSCVMGTH